MSDADEPLMTVFSAALDRETAGERAAYLDVACAENPVLRERVEALLRAHARSGPFLGVPPIDRAAPTTFEPAPVPGPSSSSGRAFDEELRRLLRTRLIVVHLLFLVYFCLLSALSFAVPPGDEGPSNRPDNGVWWRLAIPFAECLIGALVLRRSPGMSLRSLRAWELVCFATHAAFNGYERFERLAYPGVSVRIAPVTAVGFLGLSTLQGPIT